MFMRLNKSLPVLSLFHAPSSQSSLSALRLLQSRNKNEIYNLDIVTEKPTKDQLRCIIEYTGCKPSEVVSGAKNLDEAMDLISSNLEKLQRPITVDWNKGWAIIGNEQDKINQLITGSSKED
ncbi:hypothetical protein NEOLI_002859 [Neolecta irregularis DAH-3]|uniref:Redox protein fmp46, mitochondrial n=1 Tax=Neolecta irregularis (strain DAH-3) TaxID=1198029 RepID=A0A1U7LR26_NEOID|nr:hypothetical protein NEOLI_002859 [Neolecta irregularis DAH-3]|eukprot:OLL25115.1 hypothetical protein NEOLI_002859 [Neolecta irregularis DAH-3]